jgi:hypothetical protein
MGEPAPKATAPSSSPDLEERRVNPEQLVAKIAEINERYAACSKGLELLCGYWEARLNSLGENLGRETLDEMSVVGTCVTDAFLQAAVNETVEIGAVLLAAYPEDSDAAARVAALQAALNSSIMRPALQRWRRLGEEIYRRGVEKFGEDTAAAAINIDTQLTPMAALDDSKVVDLTQRRLERERRAS